MIDNLKAAIRLDELKADIRSGVYDKNLIEIVDRIRLREKQIAQNFAQDVNIGDTVVFSALANPKYLIGKKATVVGKRRKNLEIQLLEDAGKYLAGQSIGCPPEILERPKGGE